MGLQGLQQPWWAMGLPQVREEAEQLVGSMELFNQEAESIALAGIVRSPGSYWAINEIGLTPEDFIGQENRMVMKAIGAVVGDKNEPEIPLLIEELRVSGKETTVEYLHRLSNLPASLAQAKSSAGTVKKLAISRRLASAGAAIIEIAQENRADIDAAIAESESELRQVRQSMPYTNSSPNPADILRKLKDEPIRARASLHFSPTLQRLTGGLFPKNMWVLGGFSSVGKSAVACNFMVDALQQGRWVGLISTEMDQATYLTRLLSIASGVPQRAIRDRVTFSIEQKEAMVKAEQLLARAPLRIFDDVYQLQKIRSTAMRMKETEGLDVLVVDFLQNVRASAGDFAFADLTEIALDLQQLAKDLDCTVIAFSQMANDMAKEMMDTKAAKTDYYGFKGSGAIKDAGDVNVILKRARKSVRMDFEVAKNRHGETGIVIPMLMDLPTGRIQEEDSFDYDSDND